MADMEGIWPIKTTPCNLKGLLQEQLAKPYLTPETMPVKQKMNITAVNSGRDG